VWEALKILDAADAEHPEASSKVYGALWQIMGTNVVCAALEAGSHILYWFLVSIFSYRIEIYSQRAVPKILAGKPDGWNSE